MVPRSGAQVGEEKGERRGEKSKGRYGGDYWKKEERGGDEGSYRAPARARAAAVAISVVRARTRTQCDDGGSMRVRLLGFKSEAWLLGQLGRTSVRGPCGAAAAMWAARWKGGERSRLGCLVGPWGESRGERGQGDGLVGGRVGRWHRMGLHATGCAMGGGARWARPVQRRGRMEPARWWSGELGRLGHLRPKEEKGFPILT